MFFVDNELIIMQSHFWLNPIKKPKKRGKKCVSEGGISIINIFFYMGGPPLRGCRWVKGLTVYPFNVCWISESIEGGGMSVR